MLHLFRFILLLVLFNIKAVFAFEPFVVKKILVRGSVQVSEDAVIAELSPYVGKRVSHSDTNKMIKDIFNTGYFKSINILSENGALVAVVTERPIISSMDFDGTKKSDEITKILESNEVLVGRVYNANKLRVSEQQIRMFFASGSRFGVTVKTEVKDLERNRVAIKFIVTEGIVPIIDKVTFYGNSAFSSSELKKAMLKKHFGFFQRLTNSVMYSKELFEASLEELKVFYKNNGYPNIIINNSQVTISSDQKSVHIAIYLNEGIKYNIGSLSLDGDFKNVSKQELMQILKEDLSINDVFSYEKIWRVKENLENAMANVGYSKAEAVLDFDFNVNSKLCSVKFNIIPRKRQMVRYVVFVDNVITKDKVLRREIEQYEGTWLSMTKVREGKQAILRKGLAKAVDIKIEQVPGTDDVVDVIYKISDLKTSDISLNIGYSTVGKINFQVAAKLKNLLGEGVDLSASFSKNSTMSSYDVSYSDPYFTKNGTGFSVHAFRRRIKSTTNSEIFDYITNTDGVEFEWTWRLTQYLNHYFGVGYQNLKLNFANAQVPLHASMFLNNYNRHHFNDYTFAFGITYNSLDSFLFPSSGTHINLGAKFSSPPSEVLWYKTDLDYSYFYPVYKSLVFNFKTNLGLINTYGYSKSKAFPFYKNYYLGGMDSLRGYLDKGVGPLDSTGEPKGSNAKLLFKAQLFFPVPFLPIESDTMRLSAFFDAGQLYHVGGDLPALKAINKNPTGFKYSTGVGFTWMTPLGVPLEVSYAIPLNYSKTESRLVKRLNFRIGMEVF